MPVFRGRKKGLLYLLYVSPLEFELQEDGIVVSVLFSLAYFNGPKIVLGT